jgi:hypothetical protein
MNPTMTQADLVDHLLEPISDRLEREAMRPKLEQTVEEIFAARGRPRSIITPLAINLVKAGLDLSAANYG